MADLFQYKCKNCGGALEFNTAEQKLKCPFCDSVFEISDYAVNDEKLDTQEADVPQDNSQAQAPDEFDWNTQQQEWNAGEEGISVFVCKSCGGEIVGDENTAATACPYCGNPVVMSGRLSGVLKPDFIIPFKLDKRAAKEKLKEYTSSKKLAPNDFKRDNKLEEIKGIYVPFWLFDSDINAAVQYQGTRVRTWSDKKYDYTETSYYDIFRSGNMSFLNIPVDGSSKMPDDLMESIEPFNFGEAVDFQTAYFAGYLADKYDVDMEASIPRANERIKRSADDVLRGTVNGYSSLTTKFNSVQLLKGVSKYALYPVWLLNTNYKGETYTFAMNGQTGKFVGNIPVDKGKLAGIFAGATVGLTAAIYVVGRLLRIL